MTKTDQNGTTMVELLVATAVIAIFTVLMMNFVARRIADNAIKNATSDLQLQTQLTLDIINRDIKHSANVDDQNRWEDQHAPNSPTDNFSWSSDGDTLIIARPAQNQSGDILYQDPQTYVSYKDDLIYFVSGGTLYKRILAAQVSGNQVQTSCPAGTENCPADIKLADNVANFAITYYDANDNQVTASSARSAAITLRLAKSVFNRDLSEQQTARTVFRNE